MEYDESLLMQRVDGVKLAKEAEYGQPMTLHCAQCNTVLGDSVGVCGEIQSMDAIMCLSKSMSSLTDHKTLQRFIICFRYLINIQLGKFTRCMFL